MRRVVFCAVALVIIALLGCATKEKTSVKIYVQQQLYDKAIFNGKKEIAVNPLDGDTHYFLGAAYFGKDDSLLPDSPTYADTSEILLTAAYLHFNKAIEYAEGDWSMEANKNITSMFGRHFNRGVVASKQKKHAVAAVEYRLSMIGDPQNYQGYYAHAKSLWNLAIEADKSGEDAEFTEMSAVVLDDLNEVLKLGTEDKEETIDVHRTKGDVLYKRGDLDGARESYEKAIALSPENYTLIITLGRRFFNQQDHDNAVDYLNQGLAVKEGLGLIDEDDAETYSAIAIALTKLDRRTEAIGVYKKVLDLKPNDAEAMYNLMVTHYKLGVKFEEASDVAASKQHYTLCIDLANTLIGIDPNRPEYWQVRGLAKRGIGNFAGAAADLKRYRDLTG